MIFTCATDDFQKSRKNVIFENCIKDLSFEKNQMFDIFKVARPVCSHLHFGLRKHFTSKTLFLAFFTKKRGNKRTKNEEIKEIFSKTPPNCCPYKCTNLDKKSVQYQISSAYCQKNEIENVRL